MKGKYADTAIPELLAIFKKKKIDLKNVEIKLVGGSSMFSSLKVKTDIAKRNVTIIQELIKKHKLPIASKHLGGSHGRSVFFNLKTGKIQVFYAGKLMKIL